MPDGVDINKFQDQDSPVWDIPTVVTASSLKEVDDAKLKTLAEYKLKAKKIQAVQAIVLALIAGLPGILAMLNTLLR